VPAVGPSDRKPPSVRSGGEHAQAAPPGRTRRGPYEDVDVLAKRGQEAQQALGEKSGQPPVQHVGDLGLVDPEDERRSPLREAARSDEPAQFPRQ